MKTFTVALTRSYLISIVAESKEKAKRFTEFYLGDCPDFSSEKDRLEKKFLVEKIECMYNEADEVVSVAG